MPTKQAVDYEITDGTGNCCATCENLDHTGNALSCKLPGIGRVIPQAICDKFSAYKRAGAKTVKTDVDERE